jgi:hypothetical protein
VNWNKQLITPRGCTQLIGPGLATSSPVEHDRRCGYVEARLVNRLKSIGETFKHNLASRRL